MKENTRLQEKKKPMPSTFEIIVSEIHLKLKELYLQPVQRNKFLQRCEGDDPRTYSNIKETCKADKRAAEY